MNTNAINNFAVNNGPIPAQLEISDFSLGGFDLCGDATAISFPDINDNVYNLDIQANPLIDGSVLLSRLLNEKTITIRVFLQKETEGELNQLIDQFKGTVSFDEIPLTIPVVLPGGVEVREIIVSQESIRFTEDDNPNQIECEIVLKATATPRFYLKTPISKTYEGISSSFNGDVENQGSAKAYPTYYYVFGSVSGLNNIQLTIDGYTVEVSTPILTNDVLEINTDVLGNGGFVKHNGVEIDYNGRLDVALSPGSNIINFDFSGGSFDVNLSVTYKKTYE